MSNNLRIIYGGRFMGVNRLLLIEFIYSCYKFTEYTYIYEVAVSYTHLR